MFQADELNRTNDSNSESSCIISQDSQTQNTSINLSLTDKLRESAGQVVHHSVHNEITETKILEISKSAVDNNKDNTESQIVNPPNAIRKTCDNILKKSVDQNNENDEPITNEDSSSCSEEQNVHMTKEIEHHSLCNGIKLNKDPVPINTSKKLNKTRGTEHNKNNITVMEVDCNEVFEHNVDISTVSKINTEIGNVNDNISQLSTKKSSELECPYFIYEKIISVC